jgi:hypothetical protein
MFFVNALWRRRVRRPDRPRQRRRRFRRPTGMLALEVLEGRLCPSGGYLLVDSFDTNGGASVLRYNEATGAFVDTLVPKGSGGLSNSVGLILGPDQNLYASSGLDPNNGHSANVLRYDGTTGAFRGIFADGGEVTSPRGILFGPDGNLYVANGKGPGTVLRFNGKTGAFLDNFVPTGSGGLTHPSFMVFGPDGQNDGRLDLYVNAADDNTVLRYDGTTGAFKGVFVPGGTGGLTFPLGLVFGPDGDLYVASSNIGAGSPDFLPGSILRFEGPAGPNPGVLLGAFVPAGRGGLTSPIALLFGPDANGDGIQDLYVSSCVLKSNFQAQPGTSAVLRFDGVTGAFLGTFVAPDSGGLRFPSAMTFTETDPTTLNYNGTGEASAARAASLMTSPQPLDLMIGQPGFTSPPMGPFPGGQTQKLTSLSTPHGILLDTELLANQEQDRSARTVSGATAGGPQSKAVDRFWAGLGDLFANALEDDLALRLAR